jgi:hypothetical protein
MTDTSTGRTVSAALTWRRVAALAAVAVMALLALVYWVAPLTPQTVETTAFCDTTGPSIRCYPDGVGNPYVVVHRDGIWQDAAHVWRRGLPDCLDGADESVGPVRLAVVSGNDDGMAWEQVAWVGCP